MRGQTEIVYCCDGYNARRGRENRQMEEHTPMDTSVYGRT